MFDYTASKTVKEFMEADEFIRGLKGPIGSGKSTGCVAEIMRRAMAQPQATDGKRRSRWAVIRNTYRELEDTTIKTWEDWIKPPLSTWREQSKTCTVRFNDVHLEVIFRALDKPDDVKKLLSLELTGAWINEAREIPKGVLDMLQGRVGRYPRRAECPEYWNGVIMDTNPPDVDHWWYRLFEEDKPRGWKLFSQPGGLDDEAENLEHLPRDYYERLRVGHDQEWINVYVHGKYGFVRDGKPIYPEYDDVTHCRELEPPTKAHTIWVGVDFGRTPAATFSYQASAGGWRTFRELVTEDMGATKFAELLAEVMRKDLKGHKFAIFGDPSGDYMGQTDDTTPFDILNAKGIPIDPAPTNDPLIRRDAVGTLLRRFDMAGQPSLLIDPACRILRKGMAGGYKYRRLQVTGDERFHDKPDKNMYSHVCEAQQYGFLGAGEGDTVIMPARVGARKYKVKGAVEHTNGSHRQPRMPRGYREKEGKHMGQEV